METVHATAVDIGGKAVLLRGPSGSGKSDLALRLIDAGALLVADDRVALSRQGAGVVASAPATIAGRMEVRGLGIVRVRAAGPSPLRLVVDLVPPEAVERLPKAAETVLLGVAIPLMQLAPFETSTPAKLRLALRLTPQEIER
jgi:serine kinase of HPr protein (carbohydrate metabolism regulator)